MEPAAAQQQAIERIKQASNILVTVSSNPSVDQLAACIGLTLLLNRLDKHATAVFSGQIPSTIEFLQPEKTLEANTDSLQDFIISLDKNKADKLRYKVEDDFVRIFITPYRTSLTEKDLQFNYGDFNVEVVLALGVHSRDELDAAITAHGRILHDATVISVVAGKSKAPDLGQINWVDPGASSLCEMLVAMSDYLGQGLIDNQMATAFLTGIVAETQRFSNEKTSPRAMSVSAKLMSAGANQQLVISKLEPPPPPPSEEEPPPPSPKKPPEPPKPPSPSGVLNVSHQPEKADSPEVEIDSNEIRIDEEGNIVSSQAAPPPPTSPVPTLPPHAVFAPEPVPKIRPAKAVIHETPAFQPMDVHSEEEAEENPDIPGPHDLLNPAAHQPVISPPFTADTQPGWYETGNGDFRDPLSEEHDHQTKLVKRPGEMEQPVGPPGLIMPAQPVATARQAVNSAIAAAPFDPAGHPLTAFGARPLSDDLHSAPPKVPSVAAPPVPPPLLPKNNQQSAINKEQ